jgi:hypothetical protein
VNYGGGKTNRYLGAQLGPQLVAEVIGRVLADQDEVVWQALERCDQNPDTMHWTPEEDLAGWPE